MSAPCGTCNDNGKVCDEGKSFIDCTGGEGCGEMPCPTCRRVISVEEYEGLRKLLDQIVKHSLDFPTGIAALVASQACGACGEPMKPISCSACTRVVPIEDADIAVAVREIETEGLIAERHMVALPGDPFRMRWAVFSRGDQMYAGYGDSIPAALAALRQKVKP